MFNEQEQLRYQTAQKTYQEMQRRKNALSEKDKKLFLQLDRLGIGKYDVSFHTILMIAEVYGNNAINSFDTIFKLGFLKGQRAEKEKLRKQARSNA